MTPRNGRFSKPDSQGHYVRQLGWKRNDKGSKVQHKFRLGRDKLEAGRRDDRLRQLWEKISSSQSASESLWDDITLDIAKQIAKGVDNVALPPLSESENSKTYAVRLQGIQDRFSFLRLIPTDKELYTRGLEDRAIDMRNIVLIDNPYENYWRDKSYLERYVAPPLKPLNKDDVVCLDDVSESLTSVPLSNSNKNTNDVTCPQ